MSIALVVGCSRLVWDEVKAAQALATFDRVYCVKLAGVRWPDGDFTWVGLHPEVMDDYEKRRAGLGLPKGYEIVAPLSHEIGVHGNKGNVARRVSYLWSDDGHSAGSGIYGAKVAMHDGHKKIVLAGIPMDPEAGHFMIKDKNVQGILRGPVWKDFPAFVTGYTEALPRMKGKVKSMSGRTAKDLGMPTAEWLAA